MISSDVIVKYPITGDMTLVLVTCFDVSDQSINYDVQEVHVYDGAFNLVKASKTSLLDINLESLVFSDLNLDYMYNLLRLKPERKNIDLC